MYSRSSRQAFRTLVGLARGEYAQMRQSGGDAASKLRAASLADRAEPAPAKHAEPRDDAGSAAKAR